MGQRSRSSSLEALPTLSHSSSSGNLSSSDNGNKSNNNTNEHFYSWNQNTDAIISPVAAQQQQAGSLLSSSSGMARYTGGSYLVKCPSIYPTNSYFYQVKITGDKDDSFGYTLYTTHISFPHLPYH
jgi:hypothetical protein